MIFRIFLVVPAALLVWWFVNRLVRPDEVNWLVWAIVSDSSAIYRIVWTLVAFAGTVAIVASLVLFARRSMLGFIGLAAIAYFFANVIGVGYHRAEGEFMEVHTFVPLLIGMVSAVPIVFSDLLAGKQVDIVGDGQ